MWLYYFKAVTNPAAIVEPPYLNINLPRPLKSLKSSTQIGLFTSISTIALVFFVKHLKKEKKIVLCYNKICKLHKQLLNLKKKQNYIHFGIFITKYNS